MYCKESMACGIGKDKDPIQEYFSYDHDETCGGTCNTDLDAPPVPPDEYYVQLENSHRVEHLLNRRSEGEIYVVRFLTIFFLSGLFFLFVDLSKSATSKTRVAAYGMCSSLSGFSILGFFLVQFLWLRPVQRELDMLRENKEEIR